MLSLQEEIVGREKSRSMVYSKKFIMRSLIPALVETIDQAILVFRVAPPAARFGANAVVSGLAAEQTANGGHAVGAGGEENDEHVLWKRVISLVLRRGKNAREGKVRPCL